LSELVWVLVSLAWACFAAGQQPESADFAQPALHSLPQSAPHSPVLANFAVACLDAGQHAGAWDATAWLLLQHGVSPASVLASFASLQPPEAAPHAGLADASFASEDLLQHGLSLLLPASFALLQPPEAGQEDPASDARVHSADLAQQDLPPFSALASFVLLHAPEAGQLAGESLVGRLAKAAFPPGQQPAGFSAVASLIRVVVAQHGAFGG
jgi:hypothetical protein